MKLTKIGAALVLTFGMSAAAMASNTITFNGEVLETGCNITVDGGTRMQPLNWAAWQQLIW